MEASCPENLLPPGERGEGKYKPPNPNIGRLWTKLGRPKSGRISHRYTIIRAGKHKGLRHTVKASLFFLKLHTSFGAFYLDGLVENVLVI
jgi:hypothetical protein